MADQQDWIGKKNIEEGAVITAASVAGMNASLDRSDPYPEIGTELPPLWQWMLFAPIARASELAVDGHPAKGGFMPPIELPRRMFAGARLKFHQPLKVGDTVRREQEFTSITPKEGRTGPLVFVTLKNSLFGPDGLAIEEEQDIVYREEAKPGEQPPPAKKVEEEFAWRKTITPDPVLLFRYSALVFNGHRIHYDRNYAMEEEGYPGLVVHGPLIATILVELCREKAAGRTITGFNFRSMAALYDTASFDVVGNPSEDGNSCRLLALAPDGSAAMEASATFG